MTGHLAAPLSLLAHALAACGETAEARRLLGRLLAFSDPPAIDRATVYAGLRDADEALQWLETAAQERLTHLIMVPADLRFAWLRGHPRFQGLPQQMGLTNLSCRASQAGA